MKRPRLLGYWDFGAEEGFLRHYARILFAPHASGP